MGKNEFKEYIAQIMPLVEKIEETTYGNGIPGSVRILVNEDGYLSVESYKLKCECVRYPNEEEFHIRTEEVIAIG